MKRIIRLLPCFVWQQWPEFCCFSFACILSRVHIPLHLIISASHCSYSGTSKPITIPLCARQEGVILLGRARFFECSQQCFLFPGSWIEDAVDKERRRSTHTAAYAALKILLDTANIRTFCHVTCELLHIQANRLGKLTHHRILKRLMRLTIFLWKPSIGYCERVEMPQA